MEELKKIILDIDHDEKTFEECGSFIKRVIEYRHHQVMNRQRQKFEKLERKNKKNGCSNQDKIHVWITPKRLPIEGITRTTGL